MGSSLPPGDLPHMRAWWRFVPLACVLVVMAVANTGHLVGSAEFDSERWTTLFGTAAIAALLAIPCGVLVFGANFAVPLGWAAMAVEREPDPLDALSRGYEYLYRRPLQLVMYLPSVGCDSVGGDVFIADGVIAMAGIWVAAENAGRLRMCPMRRLFHWYDTADFLAMFPVVVGLTTVLEPRWRRLSIAETGCGRKRARGRVGTFIWRAPNVAEIALLGYPWPRFNSLLRIDHHERLD